MQYNFAHFNLSIANLFCVYEMSSFFLPLAAKLVIFSLSYAFKLIAVSKTTYAFSYLQAMNSSGLQPLIMTRDDVDHLRCVDDMVVLERNKIGLSNVHKSIDWHTNLCLSLCALSLGCHNFLYNCGGSVVAAKGVDTCE